MTSLLRICALAGALLAITVFTGAGSAQAPERGYIVVLHPGSDAHAEAGKAARDHGAAVSHVYEHALTGFAFKGSAQALAAIKKNPNVAYVSPDLEVSITAKPGGTAPIQPAQVTPTGLSRIGGPRLNTGAGVGVAVIDTGIQLNHPDLPAGITGVNCIRPGRAPSDDNGHGTHVAGTIGARDNAVGVLGVAPGANLYAVKVLNAAGSGSWSSVICGIDWVTANAASIKVANMSLGGTGNGNSTCATDALHAAICNAVGRGVTFVVAAGNSDMDAAGYVPAGYDEVIAVSALADFNGRPGGGAPATCRADVDDTLADFSNFGPDVDIAAPGVCILSTWKGSGYSTISGTSMASPHVAGAAALWIKTHAGDAPAAVKTGLLEARELFAMADDPDTTDEGVLNISGF